MSRASLLVLLLLLPAHPSAPAAAAEKPPFADDPRLAKRLSLAEPMIALQDALDRIGGECEVRLEAEGAIRRESVLILCRERPARDLLAQLAEALGYQWAEGKEMGYRLFEGAEARRKAHEKRLRYRLDAGRELRDSIRLIRQYEEKYRTWQPRQIAEDLRNLRESVGQMPTSTERRDGERATHAASHSQERTTIAVLNAFEALPPAAQERVLLGERAVVALQRPGALPMSPEVLASVRKARDYEARRAGQPAVRQTDDEALDLFTDLRFGRLFLYGRLRRLPDGGNYGTSLPGLQHTPSQMEHGEPWTDRLPGTVTADRPDHLLRRVGFFWPGKRRVPEDPLTYVPGVLLPEIARRLVEQEPGFAVVGDAPYRVLRPEKQVHPDSALSRLSLQGNQGALPVGELLRALALHADADLHLAEGGWVRVRSTLHFQERDGHVDSKTLREAFEPVVKAGRHTPQHAIAAAQRLRYLQAKTLSNFYLHLLHDVPGMGPGGMEARWGCWSLLGALEPARQRSLLAAGSVNYSALNPREQARSGPF